MVSNRVGFRRTPTVRSPLAVFKARIPEKTHDDDYLLGSRFRKCGLHSVNPPATLELLLILTCAFLAHGALRFARNHLPTDGVLLDVPQLLEHPGRQPIARSSPA